MCQSSSHDHTLPDSSAESVNLSPQQQQWMQQAIDLSRQNMEPDIAGVAKGGPFGAVIVKQGKVIATGANQVTASHDPTAHAEVVAIRNACSALQTFDLQGCEIYSSCEPCPMCLAAIYWARLDKVYFANTHQQAADIEFDDAWIYRELCTHLSQRQLPMIHMPCDEAQAVFRQWQNMTTKIPY